MTSPDIPLPRVLSGSRAAGYRLLPLGCRRPSASGWLQYGQDIDGFFCHHRGNQFVSSALMLPMTERFAADIRHYIDAPRPELLTASPRGRARTRSPGGTWPGTTAGRQSCSPGWPRTRPGSGGPGSGGTR